MSPNVLDFLSEEQPKSEIYCQACGSLCDPNDKVCSECGEKPVLITLGELGNNLPIGIITEDKDSESGIVQRKLIKKFELKKFNFVLEKEASNMWSTLSKRGGISPLEYITNIISHCLVVLGNRNVESLSKEKLRYGLGEMYLGDVFYMYAMLRVITISNEMPIKNMDCPRCKKVEKIHTVDLNTLAIVTRDDIDSLYKWIELQDGIEINGVISKKLKIGPILFKTISNSSESNETGMFVSMMRDCVIDAAGVENFAVIAEEHLSSLTGRDVPILKEAFDRISGGPCWTVEMECSCGFKWDYYIDYISKNFFRASSSSRIQGKLLRI